MSHQLNKNRVVYINRTSSTDKNKSWRNALSTILGKNQKDGRYYIFNSSDIDNFNVDPRIELLMTKDPVAFTSGSNNDYSTPVSDFLNGLNNSKILNLAGKAIKAATEITSAVNNRANNEPGTTSGVWQPWTQNVQAWKGANRGVEFEYEFSFAMGQYGLWNAKEEVVKPILNLIAPTLPQYVDSFTMHGPYPNAIQLLANLTYGDTEANSYLESATGESADTSSLQKLGLLIENLITKSYKDFTYTVKFGSVTEYYKVMMTNSNCTFSNEVDQFGYPVSGTAKINFLGIAPLSLSYNSSNSQAARFGIDITK